ncbi:MAG: DUF1028 domain-containing protein [Thermoanaerobaculia bacterium]
MRIRLAALSLPAALFLLSSGAAVAAREPVLRNAEGDPLVSTFSIVALDPATGDLGIAVQSKFPNVRAVVPWARAGVGAVATQSFAKVSFGSDGLDLLARGATAEEALTILLRDDPQREQRQVGIVDARGHAASWTGKECFSWAGGRVGQEGAVTRAVAAGSGVGTVVAGKGFTIQGNILVSEATVAAMAQAFEAKSGPGVELADRLMAALIAGGKAGGDQRGEQSAALLVVRKGAGYDGLDNYIDISVYDHLTPIAELERLYKLNRLYFTRSKPENMIPVTPELAAEIQNIWMKRSFDKGPANGVVDARFQKLLVDYMGWENYDIRVEDVQKIDLAKGETLKIDREVLEDIREVFRTGRWKPSLHRP